MQRFCWERRMKKWVFLYSTSQRAFLCSTNQSKHWTRQERPTAVEMRLNCSDRATNPRHRYLTTWESELSIRIFRPTFNNVTSLWWIKLFVSVIDKKVLISTKDWYKCLCLSIQNSNFCTHLFLSIPTADYKIKNIIFCSMMFLILATLTHLTSFNCFSLF